LPSNENPPTSADALIKRLKNQRGSKRVLCGKMQHQLAVLKLRAHGETPVTAGLEKAIERLIREEDQISAQIAQLEIAQLERVPSPDRKPKLSKLEKHVLLFRIDHPQASAQDVCDYFDREGIEGPKTWYPGGRLPGPGDQRQLGVIYRDKANSAIRNRIDKCVSKVGAYQEKYL